MELSQIRYTLAAARTLNFTKAAADSNVSQPALTKAVRALESELGAPIFFREGRRILLTDFGREILPHLQHIVEEANAARTLAENRRLLNQAPVRIGVMSTIGTLRLSHFLSKFANDYGTVEVAVTEAPLADLQVRLEDAALDLAILNPRDGLGEGFACHPLYEERYVVVLPPRHRLSARQDLKLADLANEPYVDRLACEMREMVMRVCDERGIELYARFRSEREDWVQAMALAGIGFAFMPEYSITVPELVQRPLVEPIVSRTVCLVTVPGRPFSPATAAFVRAAKAFAWPG